jgi:hypothetical protein
VRAEGKGNSVGIVGEDEGVVWATPAGRTCRTKRTVCVHIRDHIWSVSGVWRVRACADNHRECVDSGGERRGSGKLIILRI